MKKGFTLIEVVLAITVIGIGLLTVVGLFSSGLDAGKKAEDDTVVSTFARGAVGGFSGIAWTSVLEGASIPQFSDGFWPAANDVFLKTSVSTNMMTVSNEVYYPLRYEFELSVAPASPKSKNLVLFVWPGQYGPADKNDASVFCTTLYKYEIPQ